MKCKKIIYAVAVLCCISSLNAKEKANNQYVKTTTDEQATYRQKYAAAQKIPNFLSFKDKEKLYLFLQKKLPKRFSALEFNAVKNEVALALMKDQENHKPLALELISMFSNKSYDETWRDYCIQFLGHLLTSVKDKSTKIKIIRTLKLALKERGNGIPATAMVFFEKNIGKYEITKGFVTQMALELSTSEKISNSTKMMILQIAARNGDPRTRIVAHQVLKETNYVPLKMSAIATLGFVGNEKDYEFLESFTKSMDFRLKKPAEVAREKILKRLKK